MSKILPGLKGEEWEEGLLITRSRGRGIPRVIDEPENLLLIFENRKHDIYSWQVADLKKFLQGEYNLTASARSINEALKYLRDQANDRLIRKICAQYETSPFPDEVGLFQLFENELAWVDNSWKLRVVPAALERLGYVRRHRREGSIWIKKPPVETEGH